MKISIKVRGLVVLVGILVGNGLFLGDREDGEGRAFVVGRQLGSGRSG